MNPPRKNTYAVNRARAEQILQAYEAGVKPKELEERYDLDQSGVWNRIKAARKWRERDHAASVSD